MREGKTLDRPFLDIRDRVQFGGEEGLLSIAFDPGYARNRRFYVYYVEPRRQHPRSTRFKRKRGERHPRRRRLAPQGDRDPPPGDHQPQRRPAAVRPRRLPLHRHRRRRRGRRPGRQRPEPRACCSASCCGSTRARAAATRLPDSNPFVGAARASDEIYATGLRNPYRFSFDSATGDIWIGDVGQDAWEEIDRASRSQLAGANFGWDLFEGAHTFDGDGNAPPNYRPPVLEFPSNGGNCAVTGGYVVRDPSAAGARRPLPLRRLLRRRPALARPLEPRPAATPPPASTLDQPSSFGEGTRGRALRHLAHRRRLPDRPALTRRGGTQPPAEYCPRPTARATQEDKVTMESATQPETTAKAAEQRRRRTASATAKETFEVHRPVDGSVIRDGRDRLAGRRRRDRRPGARRPSRPGRRSASPAAAAGSRACATGSSPTRTGSTT